MQYLNATFLCQLFPDHGKIVEGERAGYIRQKPCKDGKGSFRVNGDNESGNGAGEVPALSLGRSTSSASSFSRPPMDFSSS
jgi:hypothetical protein